MFPLLSSVVSLSLCLSHRLTLTRCGVATTASLRRLVREYLQLVRPYTCEQNYSFSDPDATISRDSRTCKHMHHLAARLQLAASTRAATATKHGRLSIPPSPSSSRRRHSRRHDVARLVARVTIHSRLSLRYRYRSRDTGAMVLWIPYRRSITRNLLRFNATEIARDSV